MPDQVDTQNLEEDRVKFILDLIADLYSAGYSEGMIQVATEYSLLDFIPAAGARMAGKLEIRLNLVEQALNGYKDLIARKADELATQGLRADLLAAEVARYARELADKKAEVISKMEFAQARLDGAGNLMDESGMKYEWRFPHFDTGRPGHEICDICEEIAADSPYTAEEAEQEGFPMVPHPECDHGWVIVPIGEKTLTEQHNAR